MVAIIVEPFKRIESGTALEKFIGRNFDGGNQKFSTLVWVILVNISISIFLLQLIHVAIGKETNFFQAARVGCCDVLVALDAR